MKKEERLILDNASVLDTISGKMLPDCRVIIKEGIIEKVEPAGGLLPEKPCKIIDLSGKTLMPGLCDAHVHVTAWTADLHELKVSSPFYTAVRSAGILEDMLMRGFTTVRDEGGADYGLVQAVNEGYIKGPRVLFCGHALSTTGGHGDSRKRGEENFEGISPVVDFGRICDGIAEVRRACRDEIRKGANHIKLLVSGGVVSPTDRITNQQFSDDEVLAAVDEAAMAGLYCSAHAYTKEAVNRCLKCGVKSFEHCNLIDERSAELLVKYGAFMVPTLSIYNFLESEGTYSGEIISKLSEVKDKGVKALELAFKAGVKIAYGTDLLGSLHKNQLHEFALRASVQLPIDVIRSATCIAAELFNEKGKSGVVAKGARADLLVVDGNPTKDLKYLQDPEKYLAAIIKDGNFYKNNLQ